MRIATFRRNFFCLWPASIQGEELVIFVNKSSLFCIVWSCMRIPTFRRTSASIFADECVEQHLNPEDGDGMLPCCRWLSSRLHFVAAENFSANVQSEVCCRHKTKETPWPLVRKRTIPTERPPLVDEI
jgi:hypothetical protein